MKILVTKSLQGIKYQGNSNIKPSMAIMLRIQNPNNIAARIWYSLDSCLDVQSLFLGQERLIAMSNNKFWNQTFVELNRMSSKMQQYLTKYQSKVLLSVPVIPLAFSYVHCSCIPLHSICCCIFQITLLRPCHAANHCSCCQILSQ